MAQTFDTSRLVDSVRRRGAIPNTTATGVVDQEIVEMGTEVIHEWILPLVMKVREEFFVHSTDYLFEDGDDTIAIPTRAIGGKIRDIAGVTTNNGTFDIPRIEIGDTHSPISWSGNWGSNTYNPIGHYFMDTNIKFFPAVTNGSQVIRVFYFRRPNDLALTNLGGQVTSINTGTNEVSLNAVPSTWTVGTNVDVIEHIPHFKTIYDSTSIVAINGFDIELDDVTGISVGDYVYSEGYSPIPQIPYELHRLLERGVVARMLQSQSDPQWKDEYNLFNTAMKEALILITPRNDGSLKKVINRNKMWKVASTISRTRKW